MSGNYSDDMISELGDKEYRDLFVREFIQGGLPFQVRALREQRGWTQAQLAKKVGMKQSAISRIENPDKGTLNLATLLRLSSAFDVGLLVRFVAYSSLLGHMQDLSPKALAVPGFGDDKLLFQPPHATATSEVAKVHAEFTSEWRQPFSKTTYTPQQLQSQAQSSNAEFSFSSHKPSANTLTYFTGVWQNGSQQRSTAIQSAEKRVPS